MNLEIKTSIPQKIVYTLLFLALMWTSLFAQDVNEVNSYMSLGKQNGFIVELKDMKKGDMEDAWIDFLKENKYGKVKRNKKADEWYSSKINIYDVSRKSFSIYTKIEQRTNSSTLTSWVDLGSKFVNTNESPEEAVAFIKVMKKFYRYAEERLFNDKKVTSEKSLSKTLKELSKLEKIHTKHTEEIKKYEGQIKKANQDILVNQRNTALQEQKLEMYRSFWETVKSDGGSKDFIKEQEKGIKNAQKRLKQMNKYDRKRNDDITKMERKIEDHQKSIEENLKSQEEKKMKIAKEQEELESIKAKLND